MLIVSEIALALMLLVGAGLTVKSFAHLIRIDPGFDPRNVLAVSFPLPGARYPTGDLQRRAVTDVIDGLSQLPGVEFAGATTLLPLGQCCNSMAVTIEGRPAPAPGQEIQARTTIVAAHLRRPNHQRGLFTPSVIGANSTPAGTRSNPIRNTSPSSKRTGRNHRDNGPNVLAERMPSENGFARCSVRGSLSSASWATFGNRDCSSRPRRRCTSRISRNRVAE
jgi:hypothetical protein